LFALVFNSFILHQNLVVRLGSSFAVGYL